MSRVCTRCDREKADVDFRLISGSRRHTWCKGCESRAGSARAARARAADAPATDCAVTADNIDHVLAHHGEYLDAVTAEHLVRARDNLRDVIALIAERTGVAS